jgi:ATP-binding cassette, subfamily C, bacterial LapB
MIVERQPWIAEWLMAPIRKNKWLYFRVAIAAVMINLFALVTSLFTMTVYDRVIPNNATSSLVALSIGLAVVVIFDFLLKIMRAYFVDVAGADIDGDIGDTLFARILALKLELRQGSTGALSGLMKELESLRDFFTSATLTAVVDVPFILITVVIMWAIGGAIVVVPLIAIPVVIGTGWLTNPALDRLSSKVLRQSLGKQSVLVETIGGLEVVKASSAGRMLTQRWRAAVREYASTSLKQRLVSNIGITVAGSVQTIAYAAVVIVGVGLIADGKLSMGGLIACSILSGRALAPLSQIAQLLSRLTGTRTAYRALNDVMAKPVEGDTGQGLKLAKFSGLVEFRNLSFRYPGARDKALDGITLTIRPGEKVALLGRVGSGKSTIARMILGLYPAQEGIILVDGNEVRSHDLPHLRRNIGVVMQDTVLLTGSVRDNICLGREWISEEEMIRAATVSGTHQFIGGVVNGYALVLADRGEGLSGGQRQSISIARALAGMPSILILDEPSSAMDPQTEAQLLDRIKRESADRTMLLITHHPQLLTLVDRIIVLDGGKIIADGPRDAILKQLTRPTPS